MLGKLAIIFLFVSFHLAVSQSVLDKCPADQDLEMATASVEDIVSGAVFLDSNHPCRGGLWKRVASLNMTDPLQQCPPGWGEYPRANDPSVSVRSCGRQVGSGKDYCISTTIKTDGFEYSRVCGMIIGYQVDTPDAFYSVDHDSSDHQNDINNAYVDGISLTHGKDPRKHIWTFAAASNEYGDKYGCSCGNHSNGAITPPNFVANNFFCESARDDPGFDWGFFIDDPLWDGMGCANSNCCDNNTLPWFIAKLETATSDDIDLRLCMDQPQRDEDVAIELWEIYVQ